MKIAIVPAWLLASVIANLFGGVLGDLCAAGAAIGIGSSLGALTRSPTALSTAALPVMMLLMRYVVLPPLLSAGPRDASGVDVLAQAIVSPTALLAISVVSIISSYLLGMKWVYTGKA